MPKTLNSSRFFLYSLTEISPLLSTKFKYLKGLINEMKLRDFNKRLDCENILDKKREWALTVEDINPLNIFLLNDKKIHLLFFNNQVKTQN